MQSQKETHLPFPSFFRGYVKISGVYDLFCFSPINGLTTICFFIPWGQQKRINLEMCFVIFFHGFYHGQLLFCNHHLGNMFFLSNHQTSKSMFGVDCFLVKSHTMGGSVPEKSHENLRVYSAFWGQFLSVGVGMGQRVGSWGAGGRPRSFCHTSASPVSAVNAQTW